MATSTADRSAPAALATPIACLAYGACLLAGAFLLGSLPVAWIAVPVLLAAGLHGQRAALITALGLGALTLMIWLAWGPHPADPHALSPWLLGVPLIGAALGRARDLRAQTIDEVRASSERYALAAEGTGDGLFVWELGGNRVQYTAAFASLVGCEPDELGGTPDAWLSRVHVEDLSSLRADLDAHLEGATPRLQNEHRIRRADGSWLWVLLRAQAARDERGRALRLAGWLTDIHDRKRSEDQLRHHAFHDALSGLPNRALFMDRLTHAMARARRSASDRFAVMLLDLDRFKAINDTLGHVAGDELLVAVSQRLEGCLRPGDTVARIGGDEFMLLLEDVADVDGARRVAERIQRELALPLPLGGQDVVASASIGIAVGDSSIGDAHALLRDADTAMYEAKSRGSGQLVSFDARMHDRARERLELESALRQAIERRELSVYYQPIVELATRRILGFEALARFRHPSLGNVAPLRFIPLAEETGMIAEIGAWVLTQATRDAQRLHEQFPSAAPLSMHVNVSARQVQQDPTFVERVDRALAASGLAAGRLTIEVTEAVIMEDLERGEQLLGALRARGIHLCMDDFGTGYASLSYLHRFRVDSLKIDLSFVRDLTEPHGRSEIVHTILSLAKTLGLGSVAEGIETPQQLARLMALGCGSGQGFLFSPPVDIESIEALLRTPPHWP